MIHTTRFGTTINTRPVLDFSRDTVEVEFLDTETLQRRAENAERRETEETSKAKAFFQLRRKETFGPSGYREMALFAILSARNARRAKLFYRGQLAARALFWNQETRGVS